MNWIVGGLALIGALVVIAFFARMGKRTMVAVVVQNALEQTALPGSDINAAKVANMLVTRLWDAIPAIIDGSMGTKPSKLGLAVGALTNGLHDTRPSSDAESATFLALGSLLASPSAARAELENNADAYLIEAGRTLYLSKAKDRWEG